MKDIQILSVKEISNSKFAFLKGNRLINSNHVKRLKAEIEANGQLQPITCMKAGETSEPLIDAATKVPVQDKSDYLLVLDGQHRLMAFYQSNKLPEQVQIIPGIKDPLSYIMGINATQKPWSGTDYIGACYVTDQNEVTEYALELVNEGLKTKSINKYLFFTDKFDWKSSKLNLDKANVSRAKEIRSVVKDSLPKKFWNQACIIDAIIAKGDWKKAVEAVKKYKEDESISKLTIKQFKAKLKL